MSVTPDVFSVAMHDQYDGLRIAVRQPRFRVDGQAVGV
jgi:hypothetical protein